MVISGQKSDNSIVIGKAMLRFIQETDPMLRPGWIKWALGLCVWFSTAFLFSGEIYRWTDEKGGIHFTDDPSNIPARYRDQVGIRKATEEVPREPGDRTDSGPKPEGPAGETKSPEGQADSPDRVGEYLKTIDQKIEEKRRIEKKISELEEEKKAAEDRIKWLEKDEEQNHPSMQPYRDRSRRGFVPVESYHYREKLKLTNRIKFIQEEIATLVGKLSVIKRSL